MLSNLYKSDRINLQKMEKGEMDMKQRYDKKISNTYYPKMAEAQNDGIIFYSLMFPKIAVKSSINQDDKIEIEFINVNKIEEIIKEKRKRKKILKIILIVTSILLKNIYVTTAIIFFLAFILEDLKYFIKIVYKIKFKCKGYERLGSFHAAEHMAINAYFRSKKIPTFKDSKKESRFSNKCSSMNLICKIIIFTMIDLKIAFWDKQYFVINIIEIIFIIVVTKLVKQKGLINFLQILVTNKPTDIEIKVAIQGIKEIKKFEVDYISQMTDINTNIEKVS